jgi:hypothetical protein
VKCCFHALRILLTLIGQLLLLLTAAAAAAASIEAAVRCILVVSHFTALRCPHHHVLL